MWWLLLACVVEPEPEAMEPGAALTRLSLDLRGVRPSPDELAAVRAEPERLTDYAAAFTDDPRFGERLVDWYATVYKTRADRFIPGINYSSQVYDTEPRLSFARGLGEEPLRILARIGTHDLPFTEAVVGDWTIANDALLDGSPNLELAEDDTGVTWHLAYYTDQRPPAGVLASNGMWWRYTSTAHNHNRGRAAALATTLLCDERFEQPVVFASDLEQLDDLEGLISTEPACISCHVVADPLGAYLFGFSRRHTESGTEALYYFPEREQLWAEKLEIPPSYYGSSVDDGLADLGGRIADDPRLLTCAVEHAWTFLHDSEPEFAQTDELSAHRQAFIDDGLTLDALYTSVASHPSYLSQDESVAATVPPKRLSPAQMQSSVEALTGYSWTRTGLDVMTNDELGMRVLAGGMDGIIVTEPATTHSATQILTLQRLSELGAASLVASEAELDPAERLVFTEVTALDTAPTEAQLQAQLQHLGLLVLGQQWETDAVELEELLDLHTALSQVESSPLEVWRALLTALLRHPDFVHY